MPEDILEEPEELEEPSEETPTEADPSGRFFSPEGIIMLLAAIMLDLTGLIIFLLGIFFGIDDYGILDLIGLLVIGSWMLFRSGTITGTKGAKKIFKKTFKRLGLAFGGELIPFFGGIAPCWTIAVYFELKSK